MSTICANYQYLHSFVFHVSYEVGRLKFYSISLTRMGISGPSQALRKVGDIHLVVIPQASNDLVVNVLETPCRQYEVKWWQVLQFESHLWLRADCFSTRTPSTFRQDRTWYGEQWVNIRKFEYRSEQEDGRKAWAVIWENILTLSRLLMSLA